MHSIYETQFVCQHEIMASKWHQANHHACTQRTSLKIGRHKMAGTKWAAAASETPSDDFAHTL